MPSTTSTTDAANTAPSGRTALDFSRWLPPGGQTRAVALFLYYLAIVAALLLIYSRGDFAAPKFIYQGF